MSRNSPCCLKWTTLSLLNWTDNLGAVHLRTPVLAMLFCTVHLRTPVLAMSCCDSLTNYNTLFWRTFYRTIVDSVAWDLAMLLTSIERIISKYAINVSCRPNSFTTVALKQYTAIIDEDNVPLCELRAILLVSDILK